MSGLRILTPGALHSSQIVFVVQAIVVAFIAAVAADGVQAQGRAPCSIEQYVAPEPPVDMRRLERRVRSDARLAAQAGDTRLLLTIVCQAAAAGLADAEAMLGALSAEGAFGVAKNETQGRYWLERASRQGHLQAMLGLSDLYFDGRGGPERPTDGIILLKRAAQAGLRDAQFLLGLRYVLGNGLPRDIRAGYGWLKQAEAAGHPKAGELVRDLRAMYPQLN